MPAPKHKLLEWYVGVGDQVLITGPYEPPEKREDWHAMRMLAVDRTVDLGWVANWPKVPCEADIRTFQADNPADPSERALNYITVIAQQLMAWPKTRSQGLEILTNNNLRGFIDACSTTPIDILGLVALVALEGDFGDEPQTDDENA